MDGRISKRRAAGGGEDIPPALAQRLDHLDATAHEILAVVRGILGVVAVAPEEADRPRLDELLAEVVALQRDLVRVSQDNAASLRRLVEGLLPATKGAVPDAYGPAAGRRAN